MQCPLDAAQRWTVLKKEQEEEKQLEEQQEEQEGQKKRVGKEESERNEREESGEKEETQETQETQDMQQEGGQGSEARMEQRQQEGREQPALFYSYGSWSHHGAVSLARSQRQSRLGTRYFRVSRVCDHHHLARLHCHALRRLQSHRRHCCLYPPPHHTRPRGSCPAWHSSPELPH